MDNRYYEYAVQLHNQEFRTLSERANSTLIVQSILISGLILILIYEKNIFGYILPYVITGIVFIGGLIAFLLNISGKEGAQAAFAWRRYMRRLEEGEIVKPYKWFYGHYKDTRRDRNERDKGLISKLPLPYHWIAMPSILLFIWTIASLYVPMRIQFDSSFAIESCRCVAFWMSIAVSIIVGLFFICVLCRIGYWCHRW